MPLDYFSQIQILSNKPYFYQIIAKNNVTTLSFSNYFFLNNLKSLFDNKF